MVIDASATLNTGHQRRSMKSMTDAWLWRIRRSTRLPTAPPSSRPMATAVVGVALRLARRPSPSRITTSTMAPPTSTAVLP